MSEKMYLVVAGSVAGMVYGLFGAGGGMVLVPMLGQKSGLEESSRFPSSIAIIAPICVVSLLFSASHPLPLQQALPYLLGGAAGGVAAGFWGHRIPVVWLHRILGGLILWGGIRYLC